MGVFIFLKKFFYFFVEIERIFSILRYQITTTKLNFTIMKAVILNKKEFVLSSNKEDLNDQIEEFHYDLLDIAQFYITGMGHPFSVLDYLGERSAKLLAFGVVLAQYEGKLAKAYDTIVLKK